MHMNINAETKQMVAMAAIESYCRSDTKKHLKGGSGLGRHLSAGKGWEHFADWTCTSGGLCGRSLSGVWQV